MSPPKCALPEHLKDIRHTDYVWPMSLIKRAFNAFGPRCGKGKKGYKKWPPILIKGKGVARWETTNATKDYYIPELENKKVTKETVYGKTYNAINMKTKRKVKIKLTLKGDISPSALQKYSKKGWMKLSPWYIAQWKLIKKVEDGEDYFLFHRQGYRPDHVDMYYNWGPMLGLKMD